MDETSKSMSLIAFIVLFTFAIMSDLLGILLPFVGVAFIAVCRFVFWMLDYDMRGSAGLLVGSVLTEILPILPGSMAFVVLSYFKSQKNASGVLLSENKMFQKKGGQTPVRQKNQTPRESPSTPKKQPMNPPKNESAAREKIPLHEIKNEPTPTKNPEK